MSSKANKLGKSVRQKQEGGRRSPETARAKQAAVDRSDEPTKRLNVDVPESLYERFKATCEAEGRSLSWVVRRMLEGYVSDIE